MWYNIEFNNLICIYFKMIIDNIIINIYSSLCLLFESSITGKISVKKNSYTSFVVCSAQNSSTISSFAAK